MNRGDKNSETMNSTPEVADVSPVLPPTAAPADDSTNDDAALISKLTAQVEPLAPELQITVVVDHNYCE